MIDLKFKKILFRVDSSSKIGTGHVMRDLVLAKEYKKSEIFFATQNLSGNINHKIIESDYQFHTLKSNKINELISLIKKLSIDLLVLDIYSIDYKDELRIKNKTGVKILSIDDTYNKHNCDILLNHNIYAKKSKYKNLVPKNCELRCGSKYTLIRDEFKKEQMQHKKKTSKKKLQIFLAMGGTDTKNMNIKILKLLKEFNNIRVNLVTTTANKNLSELKKYCKKENFVSLYIDSNQIAKLISNSDFAIISASVIANEAYYMQIPFLAVQTASNQEYMYKFLKKQKYPVCKKPNKRILLEVIKSI